ncbi:MAG: selenocysteine-specific translation elongation factor [Actinomycetota bacterium]
MPIIGTAGHVDHGKSTLVEALTGRDPDRWAEEKERGLTIDLGFAWTEIDGMDVGFVDVPGHERFIKNMLAGVGAVDCALLVVAADSGWMPQTEEHAAVLHLLEAHSGVIALTRIDLVDHDTLELATLEVLDEIEGTVLEGWPVVPVSAVTGTGMNDLATALATALGTAPDLSTGPLRMWIDRAFTVSGSGVVVTGTVAQGSMTTGDQIEILPQGQTDKIRGLHHHDEDIGRAQAGSRTAINLQSTRLEDAQRGNLVCTPGSIGVSGRFLALINAARSFDGVPQRGAFHVHIGTAHSPATIRRLHDTNKYLVTLEEPLPVAMGDRIILRDAGRRSVVGGGRVLDPQSPRRVPESALAPLESALSSSPNEMANALLTVRGVAAIPEIFKATGGGTPSTGLRSGDTILSDVAVADIESRAESIVESYHADHPLRPGIPSPELATQIGTELHILDAVIANSEAIRASKGAVHLATFEGTLMPDQEAEWLSVQASLESSFDVPRMSAIDLPDELLHALIRRGDLIQITPDLVFTRSQTEDIHARLTDLPSEFSVAQFRDEFGMTRRQAVPTLEWLDRTGWTRRSGDVRTVRR